MSTDAFLRFLETETKNLRHAGLWRLEAPLETPPGPVVKMGDRELVSFASTDYLGLARHADVKRAAAQALEAWGASVAAPRMATGTLPMHGQLERRIAGLLGTGEALLYPSGHHAKTGLFESLLGDRDYVFCDEMIDPSFADGVRLSRARVYSYRNADVDHLEDRLKRSGAARFRMIATDAVFLLNGRLADLERVHALAEKYRAIVVVDDSHGLGVLGPKGAGSYARVGLGAKIDLVTGSFGHALAGSGGFVAGRTTIVAWLRQKSRPHLASNALSPPDAAAALESIELLGGDAVFARQKLEANVRAFTEALSLQAGVTVEAPHPAISLRVRNAVATQRLVDFVHRKGIFVLGYCHPVVPEGEARISIRVTAAHSPEDVARAAEALGEGIRALQIAF